METPIVNLVVAMALFYSAVDLALNWAHYSSCSRPLKPWLLCSYFLTIGYKIWDSKHCARARGIPAMHEEFSAAQISNLDFFVLNLFNIEDVSPPLEPVRSRCRLLFTVLRKKSYALPMLALWTAIGSAWLQESRLQTPECLANDKSGCFVSLWLFACCLIIFRDILGVAMTCLLTLRYSTMRFELLDTQEIRSKWGDVVMTTPVRELRGVAPLKISELPIRQLEAGYSEQNPCSICLEDFSGGDHVRKLPDCGHRFHRS